MRTEFTSLLPPLGKRTNVALEKGIQATVFCQRRMLFFNWPVTSGQQWMHFSPTKMTHNMVNIYMYIYIYIYTCIFLSVLFKRKDLHERQKFRVGRNYDRSCFVSLFALPLYGEKGTAENQPQFRIIHKCIIFDHVYDIFFFFSVKQIRKCNTHLRNLIFYAYTTRWREGRFICLHCFYHTHSDERNTRYTKKLPYELVFPERETKSVEAGTLHGIITVT